MPAQFGDEPITIMAENTIRLLNALTDTELEDCLKKLGLVDEYLENFAHDEGRPATTIFQAISKRPEGARGLARLMISTNFIIYPGAKKLLRLRKQSLHIFALDFKTRKTPAAQLVWDLRLKHGI